MRIGVGVTREAVRVVLVHRGRILYAASAAVGDERALDDALAELLGGVPLRIWRRTSVVVAIGPAAAQTRRLAELPPTRDVRALTSLVRESTSRFFLKNGVPLVTGGVEVTPAGVAWAAAFDRPAVEAIERACDARKVRLVAVVPSVAVIPRVLAGAVVRWPDGDVVADVTYGDGGRLLAVRRLQRSDPGEVAPQPVANSDELERLGADGWRFADAFGSALAALSEPLAYRPGDDPMRASTPLSRARLGAALLALAVAALAALLAPSVAANRAATRAGRHLGALAEQRQAAAKTERSLAEVAGALADVERFERERRSMTLFLASLTRALPATTAILTLRADSTGGEVVALAPHGAAVIAQLAAVPDIATPGLAGPVTPAGGETQQLERVTARFQWKTGAARRETAVGGAP